MILLHLALVLFGDVTVTLPMAAEARGTELTVDAVARVEGADPAEVARVGSLSLGYAPAPGYTRLFDAWRLQQEIQRAAPDVVIQVVGARACRVSPATEIVSGAAVEAAARAELERQLAELDSKVRLITPIADLQVPAGRETTELRSMLAVEQVRAGDLSVPVRVMVDGDVYRTVWTRWELEVWGNYTVLTRPVEAGARIQPDMVETRRLESSTVNLRAGARSLGRGLLVGSVAAHDLPAGRPLTELDVVRPILVREGDTTFLEVKNGAIRARVGASADEDGAQGDRISVTLHGSGRQMKGTVISRDLVRVDLSSPK